MGDSVSLPTNVAHSDTVSRIQQGSKTDENAEQKFAKKLRDRSDQDETTTKNISETEKLLLKRRRREEESRRRREDAREEARKKSRDDGRGGNVDLKV